VLGDSEWFLSTLRVFLVTEHVIMKVRHLRKLMAVVLARFPGLPMYWLYGTSEPSLHTGSTDPVIDIVDAHTGPMV